MDFNSVVFPVDVQVGKKWVQVSGQLGTGEGGLPGQIKVEAKFEDENTGRAGQKISLTLKVDEEGNFSAGKKIKKNIKGGQIMRVTLQTSGGNLPKGTRVTLCVDLVKNKSDADDLPACVEGGGSGSGTTLSSIQDEIFTPTCAVSGCHSAGSASGGLVLVSGQSHGNLVGVRAVGVANLDRVEPGDAERSYLIKKLRGDPDINGVQMPRGGPPLSDAQIAGIVDWIESGAPNN
jgi:hypothetical protein